MDDTIFPDLGDYVPSTSKPSTSDQSKKKSSSYFGSSTEEKIPVQEAKAEKKKPMVPIPAAKPETVTKAAGILSRWCMIKLETWACSES